MSSVQDLIHLEYRRQCFNQQRGLDGAARQIKAIFSKAEDRPLGLYLQLYQDAEKPSGPRTAGPPGGDDG
jgi:hypothetical protein